MTNEERIREEIVTTEKLANYLIVYNDYYGMIYASDGSSFYDIKEAIDYEIDWLQTESSQ